MEVPKSERPRIEDIVSYTPEEYLSEDEVKLIRSVFNGPQGARVLKVVRKIMLPTVANPDLPLEKMGQDVFLSAVDFKSMPDAEVKPIVLGLQLYIKAVSGGLINLRDIANVSDESPADKLARLKKDSAR